MAAPLNTLLDLAIRRCEARPPRPPNRPTHPPRPLPVCSVYFMQVAQLPPTGFFVGQLTFMCWNAINDPVFGWISDRLLTGRHKRSTAVRVGGVVWAATFVALWLPLFHGHPWLSSLHFVATLCAYDGALTYVELNLAALLAEVSGASVCVRAGALAGAGSRGQGVEGVRFSWGPLHAAHHSGRPRVHV